MDVNMTVYNANLPIKSGVTSGAIEQIPAISERLADPLSGVAASCAWFHIERCVVMLLMHFSVSVRSRGAELTSELSELQSSE